MAADLPTVVVIHREPSRRHNTVAMQINSTIAMTLLFATWMGSSSCDMIPFLGDDSEPVAQGVMRQADQLAIQAEEMAAVAVQMQEKAKALKEEYTLLQKEADAAKLKWDTMEEQAKTMQTQAADMKSRAGQMKKQAEKLSSSK